MESVCYVSTGKTGGSGSEKTDYRNLWRVGTMVHRQLFYRRGQKREYQL